MDGPSFALLVASRATPSLGDSVRPAHMATLRRCWNASYAAQSSALPTPSGGSETRAASHPAQLQTRPSTNSLRRGGAEDGDPNDGGRAFPAEIFAPPARATNG